jgi:hypothetical protein
MDMARTRTATRRSGSDIVVVQAASPPARRRSGGGSIRRRRSGGRRRRSVGGGGGGGGDISKRIQNIALGGLAYGLLVKHFPQLPRIPGIGRSGTVALGVYFMKPKSRLLQDIGIAAAAIAGASFGETGTVSGDGENEVLSD